ncbi:MAG: hypothetical protein HY481_01645 [Candidatus Vogelbacteria bacterium]|nr:hypothetical protein [Candidatus Vogelbacteria bacterium]
MKNSRWLIFALVPLLLVISFTIVQGQGSQAVTGPLSGWAWSSNIGWISFKGSNYGVELDDVGGGVSKTIGNNDYAWSSNIGWISFNSNTGMPPDGGSAGVTLSSGNLTGWARACSVYPTGICSGNTLRLDSERGGWDGWIKMNPMNDPAYDVRLVGNKSEGFAWGADVVGWIDFCVNENTGACVNIDELEVECTANGEESGGEVDVGDTVIWEAIVTSVGTPPYTYCWGTGCGSDVGVGGEVTEPPSSTNSIQRTYSVADDEVVAEVMVTDNAGKSGRGICSIKVVAMSYPTLRVTVNGGDERGRVDADSIPVPVSGSITNCRTSSGSCSADYTLGDTVTLTATHELFDSDGDGIPETPYLINWRVGDCDSNPTPETCEVKINGPDSVTVTFTTGTEEGVTLMSTPAFLEINSHNEGQVANTQLVTITASSGGSLAGAKLCLDSFESNNSFSPTYFGDSIFDIVPSDNINDKVVCFLNGNPFHCDAPNAQQVDQRCDELSPVGTAYQATFKVQVPERFSVLQSASPYLIKLSVLGNNLTGNLNIPFLYRTGGGGP